MVCKIIFCSEFSDKAGRKKRRRRTQAIAKRYAFNANAINIHQRNEKFTIIIKGVFRTQASIYEQASL